MPRRRKTSKTDEPMRVVLEPVITNWGLAYRGDLLDRTDPRFDLVGTPWEAPVIPAPRGEGEVLTATDTFNWHDGDRTIQIFRGDQYRSEHPVVKAYPDSFVKFDVPRLEQRDVAPWVER